MTVSLFFDRILRNILSKRFAAAQSPECLVGDQDLDSMRERVHELLRPQPVEVKQSFDELFAGFVAMNRKNGVDPSKDEAEGDVVYAHPDSVPMQGDLYWGQGRTISRAEIDKKFRDLDL